MGFLVWATVSFFPLITTGGLTPRGSLRKFSMGVCVFSPQWGISRSPRPAAEVRKGHPVQAHPPVKERPPPAPGPFLRPRAPLRGGGGEDPAADWNCVSRTPGAVPGGDLKGGRPTRTHSEGLSPPNPLGEEGLFPIGGARCAGPATFLFPDPGTLTPPTITIERGQQGLGRFGQPSAFFDPTFFSCRSPDPPSPVRKAPLCSRSLLTPPSPSICPSRRFRPAVARIHLYPMVIHAYSFGCLTRYFQDCHHNCFLNIEFPLFFGGGRA